MREAPDAVGEMLDREAIRRIIYLYCRGVDRCDQPTLESAFWPDSTMVCGTSFAGPAQAFCDWIVPAMREWDRTSHMVGNIVIDLDGDTAFAESYAHCYNRLAGPAGTPVDLMVGCRYLDIFARRDGAWRIAKRTIVYDWYRAFEDSGDWEVGFLGQKLVPGTTSGAQHPDDILYRMLADRA